MRPTTNSTTSEVPAWLGLQAAVSATLVQVEPLGLAIAALLSPQMPQGAKMPRYDRMLALAARDRPIHIAQREPMPGPRIPWRERRVLVAGQAWRRGI